MLFKTVLTTEAKLSPSKETLVKINDDYDFVVKPQASEDDNYIFHVCNEKGKFEIQKIKEGYSSDVAFDVAAKSFTLTIGQLSSEIQFSIAVNMEYTKNETIVVPYGLFISYKEMENLEVFEYFERTLKLAGHAYLKFKCYVKKLEHYTIQVQIENNYDGVKIEGKFGDYEFPVYLRNQNDIAREIHFVFNPKQMKQMTTNEAANQELFGIFSNTKHADVVFVTKDAKNIPSFRCVLAKHSPILEALFDKDRNLPVKIQLEEFEAKTVQIILDFLHGKSLGISGDVKNVYDFAEKYEMKDLKVACAAYMIKHIEIENVADYLAIAAANNFETLAHACKSFLKDKKTEITPNLQKQLPVGILFETLGVIEDE